jgi:CDI immunity proteins
MKLIDADPTLANRPNFGSGLSDRIISLHNKSLTDLTLGELALCLRQSVAIAHVVPLSLAALASQPLLEADRYPGDLLSSLLHAAKNSTLSEDQLAALHSVCCAACSDAETIIQHVIPEAMAFLGQVSNVNEFNKPE